MIYSVLKTEKLPISTDGATGKYKSEAAKHWSAAAVEKARFRYLNEVIIRKLWHWFTYHVKFKDFEYLTRIGFTKTKRGNYV